MNPFDHVLVCLGRLGFSEKESETALYIYTQVKEIDFSALSPNDQTVATKMVKKGILGKNNNRLYIQEN